MYVFNGGQWHIFVYTPPTELKKKKIIVMAKLKCIIFTKFQSSTKYIKNWFQKS